MVYTISYITRKDITIIIESHCYVFYYSGELSNFKEESVRMVDRFRKWTLEGYQACQE